MDGQVDSISLMLIYVVEWNDRDNVSINILIFLGFEFEFQYFNHKKFEPLYVFFSISVI